MGGPSAKQSLICADDLRKIARQKIPRFAFDFIDGGAGSELGLARNRAAFDAELLHPRILRNTDGQLSTAKRFLGREWSVPFGIPPFGMAAMAGSGTDQILAASAERNGLPYVASTPASASLEELKRLAPANGWFQLYVGRSQDIVDGLIARAETAGYETLVVTADVPRPGKRRRDLRNGLTLPLKMTPRMFVDLLRHPGWSMGMLLNGTPRFANLEPYAASGAGTHTLAQLMQGQSSGRLDWELLARIRKRWSGHLVLKGVLSPLDARTARDSGVDAVIVSNHGGRQLDAAPAPLQMLGGIRAEVGTDFPLAIDGGLRCGEDILKALLAGADFAFIGRPFLYSVAARGREGPDQLFNLLQDELLNAMSQIGLRSIQDP
ncbi:alpha-hydroxy acid oxidase [Nitratireductor pacificus]|uniref:FMN-dependent alpha-hydroxy acid dehydrogenase n=1 Tax=Nitratireductor pacificus pht-3B TaxID=391937 RepID=K2LNS2_9HYPH|nr:alpha-hydroxy acid oxidase [Nitratireductor pacificus]EKF19414.1 FMN-dependent alpha-hydroxy acid dehydrogenase [Nitratireductor pacificus pht-3B]